MRERLVTGQRLGAALPVCVERLAHPRGRQSEELTDMFDDLPLLGHCKAWIHR